ncbi:hypothetical protein FH5_02339 [Priestia endophytica]|nr:hypothetical protein FH5_02339 [Priestia endophytica]
MQKLQDTYNEFLNLGHTDNSTLKKDHDQCGKSIFIQMETLSA